ncbi:MAG: 50S ribosomal protein L24e [Thermoplasmatales archaeon]
METRYCSFCGKRIEFGTGKMFVKKDGSILYFDSSKCEKNYLKLGREPRNVRWTKEGREEKLQRSKSVKETGPDKEGKAGFPATQETTQVKNTTEPQA